LRDHVCPNVGHRTDPSPVRLHRPLRSN
jgi:hypothetical protein